MPTDYVCYDRYLSDHQRHHPGQHAERRVPPACRANCPPHGQPAEQGPVLHLVLSDSDYQRRKRHSGPSSCIPGGIQEQRPWHPGQSLQRHAAFAVPTPWTGRVAWLREDTRHLFIHHRIKIMPGISSVPSHNTRLDGHFMDTVTINEPIP